MMLLQGTHVCGTTGSSQRVSHLTSCSHCNSQPAPRTNHTQRTPVSQRPMSTAQRRAVISHAAAEVDTLTYGSDMSTPKGSYLVLVIVVILVQDIAVHLVHGVLHESALWPCICVYTTREHLLRYSRRCPRLSSVVRIEGAARLCAGSSTLLRKE